MSGAAQSPDAKRLAGIRERIGDAAIPDDEFGWTTGYEGSDRVIVDGMTGDVVLRAVATTTPDEFELAAHAPGDIAFLLSLIDRATDRIRRMEEDHFAWRNANPMQGERPGQDKNYAAQAAIMVQGKPGLGFRVFLRHHPDAKPVGGASADRDPEDIATDRLRAILGIETRAQLNRDRKAAERWIALRAEWDRFQAMPADVRRAHYPGYGDVMAEAAQ